MMRRSSLSGTTATLAGLVCAMAGTPGVRADDAAEAAGLWWQIRRADVDSADFKDAQSKLTALTGAMPAAKRAAVAAAMMDPQAEPVVNAEALRRFGKDPLPITDIQRILWDAERSYQQRVLLKTYYSFCRAEARTSILSETTRRQLVAVLAERLENLVGAKMSYGEQRLLTHLCSHVLSRYGRAAKSVPQAKGLIAALEKYVEKADPADGFGAAIPVWLDLTHSSGAEIDTFGKAVHALGHWDPLVRWNATSRLGEEDVPVDDKAAQVVVSLFTDPRDEVRAGAARVFAVAKDYRPDVIVPKMVGLLTHDRGVIVQAAAAEALIARRSQAQGQIDELLAAMDDPARTLGANRTSSILLVLAKLVEAATLEQKKDILMQAARNLTGSPAGALAVMEALGPQAVRAVPSIREYLAKADRFRRIHINRHVLPAILPDEPVGR
ncbi:MAG: hypothetical protein WBF17_11455 [Phycisphaerae bacterium]